MLFRRGGDAVIAIAQPSHSWLSGQLVRAWGNEAFAVPTPHEEVRLGAEQHDIGWLDWEAAPTLNPSTGLPHEFREVGTRAHTELWTRGVRLALAFGRYPALLVSLHAKTIYDAFFDFDRASREDASTARKFLAEQHEFRRTVIETLASDPRYAAAATPEAIERNRRLVGATDHMSLEIGWGVTEEARVPDVPSTGTGRIELRIRSPRRDPTDLVLDPWPFSADRVDVLCEGRRLHGAFADETAMRQTLDAAERVVIAAVLRPR